jgi:hypothetical protein
MLLSSSSSRKKYSLINKSIKSRSSKRISKNNSKQLEKPPLYVSKFKVNTFKKNKNKDSIEKTNPINKMCGDSKLNYNNYFTENPLNNLDQNSTFVFTGDNASCLDVNQIIENYLKKPLIKPVFECMSISTISIKEENDNIPNDNSFSLSSSKTSLHSKVKSTKISKNINNEKLMEILKQINSNDSKGVIDQHNDKKERIPKSRDNTQFQDAEDLRKKVKKNFIKKTVKKRDNKLLIILFVLLNIFIYANLIIKLFEPSVSGLFYNNDHVDYKYSTSLLSQDRNIMMNK